MVGFALFCHGTFCNPKVFLSCVTLVFLTARDISGVGENLSCGRGSYDRGLYLHVYWLQSICWSTSFASHVCVYIYKLLSSDFHQALASEPATHLIFYLFPGLLVTWCISTKYLDFIYWNWLWYNTSFYRFSTYRVIYIELSLVIFLRFICIFL